MNVCLFCCILYLVRVLIVVNMGRWSELSVYVVCVENDVCEDGVCSVYVWW